MQMKPIAASAFLRAFAPGGRRRADSPQPHRPPVTIITGGTLGEPTEPTVDMHAVCTKAADKQQPLLRAAGVTLLISPAAIHAVGGVRFTAPLSGLYVCQPSNVI